MSVIDKNMYEKMKGWFDYDAENRPNYQQIMYVNSHNRKLTNATIRKLMYDIHKEDVEGEIYMSFYSADNFCNNMRDYYSEIGVCYHNEPGKEEPIVDIIEKYPPSCGWIILFVGDIEVLTEKTEKMQEVLETLYRFASKHASVVLVGDRDYKDIFARYEYLLNKINTAIDEDDEITIGYYNQEANPIKVNSVFESPEKHRDELNFYWKYCLYDQLKKRYFDYEDFKDLIRETMEYIIPRVSKQKVYRKDVWLIEHIGALRHEQNKNPKGCEPWKFEAAQKFAKGIHEAITNYYGDNDDLSEGKVGFYIRIERRKIINGAVYLRGSSYEEISVKADTVNKEMDCLAEWIRDVTYNYE